jgi:hypothetical protein
MALPVMVGVDLVDEHSPVLTAMAGQVALTVAVEVEPAGHDPAR